MGCYILEQVTIRKKVSCFNLVVFKKGTDIPYTLKHNKSYKRKTLIPEVNVLIPY